MAELNVQLKNMITELRQAYPELKSYSDEQILSLYNEQLNNIQLSENERISIMNGQKRVSNDNTGLVIESNRIFELSQDKENELLNALKTRVKNIEEDTAAAEKDNSVVGHIWSWAKNNIPLLDKITDSSNEVRVQQKKELDILNSKNIKEAFEEITGVEFN